MKSLNMIGGGAKSPLWCQIFADVLDCEIRQVEHPMQANARGAAYIASAGLGYIEFDDIPNLTPIEKTYFPSPETRRTYDELYGSFLRIHQKNKGIYKRLNSAKPAAKG
jgi:xylulokinase